MGYRSEVTAYFYITQPQQENAAEEHKKATALFDLWWQAVEADPMFVDNFGGCVRTTADGGRLFQMGDVKWYDSYPDVRWFEDMKQRYVDELVDNETMDGGSQLNKWFCAEFVRIGENYEDVVTEYHGYSPEYRVNVQREISVDIPNN